MKPKFDRENLQDFFNSDYYKQNKTELIRYIAKETGVKEASARRNINRMEAYYTNKNVAQKRTGAKTYLDLISKFNDSKTTALYSVGGQFVSNPPDYLNAFKYAEGLEGILHIRYNKDFIPEIIRYYIP